MCDGTLQNTVFGSGASIILRHAPERLRHHLRNLWPTGSYATNANRTRGPTASVKGV
jgi:hypothetical protein